MIRKMIRDPATMQHVQFPNAVGLLHRMRQQGIRTGLATMSTAEQAYVVLAVLGLHKEFDCVVTCQDVPNGKPNPSILLLAAHRLHVPPDQCLVVEDSVPGALAAGMWCVAVPNDSSRRAFASLESLDTRWVVHQPDELERLVQRMMAERALRR